MQLVIDGGNTFVKWGIFLSGELVASGFWHPEKESIPETIEKRKFEAVLVSKVGRYPTVSQLNALRNTALECLFLNHQLRLPFDNRYQSPETLGKDRIALVAGLTTFAHGSPCLAIDAGTCLTFDLLDEKLSYLGGSISPGLQMRMNAMHEQTAKLPHYTIEGTAKMPLIGQNTEACMKIGGFYGLVHEINGFIKDYQMQYPDLQIYVTGGNARLLHQYLAGQPKLDNHLALSGLYQILKLNVSN